MSQKFNISIPSFLILEDGKKHNSLNFNLIEGKVLVGLCGYAKAGKDAIASNYVKKYGFKRIAFADNVKKEMNQYMKELIYEDINNSVDSNEPSYLKMSDIDFTTENLSIKRKLRPYIIWYGELMRELNGVYYWINKAFENDANGYDKLIISDVRRPKELEIFENSNSFKKRTENSFALGNYFPEKIDRKVNSHSSLLFCVNQYGLTDDDLLTHETIRLANEKWLFDETFFLDSRIPEEGSFRKTALEQQVKSISDKFGIKKINNTISKKQLKIF